MRDLSYRKIPIWENRRRLALLQNFRDLVVKYDDEVSPPTGVLGNPFPQDTDASLITRKALNLVLDEISWVLWRAGISATITWTPPGITGGSVQQIPIIPNFFNLPQYQIPNQVVLDQVDRAIGIYTSDQSSSQFRTWNPFFWMGLGLDFVADSAFAIARRSGFDTKKIEDTWYGRMFKFVVWALGALVLVLTLMQQFDLLESFREFVGFDTPAPLPLPKGSTTS